MNRVKTAAIALLAVAGLALTGCSNNNEAATNATKTRQEKAAQIVPCGDKNESLECKNLKRREQLMSDPNAIGYVYEINFDGSTNGYYVIKGKVSSTQSQMGPMDILADACIETSDYCPEIMEAAGDDGSYGPNEDGIFFFLVNGTMVTYNGIYRYSSQPLPLITTKKLG